MEKLLNHILYINLDHRTDRKEHLIGEFKKLGIEHAQRFPAIRMQAGNVGCTLSHIRCLELAKSRKWPYVCICEDDITFTNSAVFLESLRKFAESDISWDVLVLGGNNAPPFTPINNYCVRVQNIQTTTGYIVTKEYYDVLLANFKEGLDRLMREPEKKKQFSLDIYWKGLQFRDRWYCLIPLTVIQYYDYSDIEEKVMDYSGMMLDLEKRALMERLMREQQQQQKEEKKKTRISMFWDNHIKNS
jgi:GR25 family glycosyltransferase involved in LPS biosynthesis